MRVETMDEIRTRRRLEAEAAQGAGAPSMDTRKWGMTLRDWLAGQAVSGAACLSGDEPPAETAQRAYAVADAMLAERRRARWPMGRPGDNEGR